MKKENARAKKTKKKMARRGPRNPKGSPCPVQGVRGKRIMGAIVVNAMNTCALHAYGKKSFPLVVSSVVHAGNSTKNVPAVIFLTMKKKWKNHVSNASNAFAVDVRGLTIKPARAPLLAAGSARRVVQFVMDVVRLCFGNISNANASSVAKPFV